MGDVNIDDSAEEVDELLADAPPEPFDWDNRQHQDAVDSFYLKNVTEYRYKKARAYARVHGATALLLPCDEAGR